MANIAKGQKQKFTSEIDINRFQVYEKMNKMYIQDNLNTFEPKYEEVLYLTINFVLKTQNLARVKCAFTGFLTSSWEVLVYRMKN